MKKKILILLLISLTIIAYSLTACDGYDTALFSQTITDSDILESNVCLVKKTVDGNSFSYNKGASGVIYNYKDQHYYILTAYHAVKDLDKDDCLYIMLFDDTVTDGPASWYYDTLPIGTVEYGDDKYDLAIVSFVSERKLSTITLSSQAPDFKDKVAAIGNPANRGRNYISFGTITSKEPVPFGDETDDIQFNVITHSAYVSEGSSGGMLINEDAELVGINLGGVVNGFGKFIEGKAMPIDKIIDFLNDYSNIVK